jgi:RP/EB family microtubule-associated protein
MSQNENFGIMD